MKLSFEWDEEKAKANLKKHRVGFDEATTVFTDPFSMTIHDPDHSADEQRYIDIGSSDKGPRAGNGLHRTWLDHTYYQLPKGNPIGAETL